MFKLVPAILFLSLALAGQAQTPPTTPHPGPTLAKIRAAKALACGVDFEEAEYSTQDAHGNHSLFDLDLCKAIAVAALGPNARFNVVPYRAEADANKDLAAGEIDVLATGSVNYLNAASARLGAARPVFHDYQGFMVNRNLNIHSARDLANKKICFLGGTEIEIQLEGFMQRERIPWLPFSFQEEGEMEAAFITGNCAAITADVSQLAFERIAFKSMAQNFVILPDVIAKDPLAPTYRLDDPEWAAIVNWVVEVLIQAEESGVTQSSLAGMRQSRTRESATTDARSHTEDPVLQRLLGLQHGYGQYLDLDDAWAANVIAAVGNYGELFERTLGSRSVMRLDRGANSLWTHGGLMTASPIR